MMAAVSMVRLRSLQKTAASGMLSQSFPQGLGLEAARRA